MYLGQRVFKGNPAKSAQIRQETQFSGEAVTAFREKKQLRRDGAEPFPKVHRKWMRHALSPVAQAWAVVGSRPAAFFPLVTDFCRFFLSPFQLLTPPAPSSPQSAPYSGKGQIAQGATLSPGPTRQRIVDRPTETP